MSKKHAPLVKKTLKLLSMTQAQLSRKLDVTPQFVYLTITDQRYMPFIHAFKIQKMTKGEIKVSDFYPETLDI